MCSCFLNSYVLTEILLSESSSIGILVTEFWFLTREQSTARIVPDLTYNWEKPNMWIGFL
jgi:hypothetical protein